MTFSSTLFVCALVTSTNAAPPRTIPTNRAWDVLDGASGATSHRALLAQAGRKLGAWPLYLDAVKLTGARLRRLANKQPAEPLVRVLRESLRRPVDVEDLLYFLDDVLVAGAAGLRGQLVWVPASRARKAGIFLHTDDVFFARPRRYGETGKPLKIDRPRVPTRVAPCDDGALLGPCWTARYSNPAGKRSKLRALQRANGGDFAERVEALLGQLKQQGATVLLYSTVRERKRGYLMWGAFTLKRAASQAEVEQAVDLLQRRNQEWGLDVAIHWQHPDGWRATREAARLMADAYQVVYATEKGARDSDHYDGNAVDLNVFGLPRRITLTAPDGARQSFDLSAPEQARDLSLTPELIDWIEPHFGLVKLRRDYPHWSDASAEPASAPASAPSAPADDSRQGVR